MREWPRVPPAAHGADGPAGDEPGARGGPRVALPLRLHADGVEDLLERLPPVLGPPRFDVRHVRAAEPCAYLSLLMLAEWHGVAPPALPVPPGALLPPVRLADAGGVVAFFEAVGGPSFARGVAALGWGSDEARRISSVVAELARNAVEHAGAPAWVAGWRTAPGELRLAVADGGMGFAGSLRLREERDAVLQGLLHGASRSGAPGRGQGLRRVGQVVGDWGGRMRIRSRTVVISGTPPWHDAVVQSQLPFLPGVQVEVVLPLPEPRLRLV